MARLVGGQAAGEGAAYRVDLRLRPHGRMGALAVSLSEALRYYNRGAQAWELQTLIRARASAGATDLFARFYEGVRERVYTHAASVPQALSNVRLAKQKIDRDTAWARGASRPARRGGIREIEFVAQALQLAHGGSDRWLRHAPHTLVSLGRLADRGYITERERTELSAAYNFLRAAEHRLQMEHGLQTHTVPEDAEKRALLARRLGFAGANALAEFDGELAAHAANVCAAFERVSARRECQERRAGRRICSETADDGEARRYQTRRRNAQAHRAGGEAEGARDRCCTAAAEVFATRLRPGWAAASRTVINGSRAGENERQRGEGRRNGPAMRAAGRRVERCSRIGHAARDPPGTSRGRRRRGVARKSDEPVEFSEESLARSRGAAVEFARLIEGAASPPRSTARGGGGARETSERCSRRGGSRVSFRAEWRRCAARGRACCERPARSRGRVPRRVEPAQRTGDRLVNVALLVARASWRGARRPKGPRLSVLALGRLASGGMDYGQTSTSC